MPRLSPFLSWTSVFLAAAAFSACGGGEASLGGTLSGLPSGTSVTLQNNGANDLTVAANGSFWFSGTLASGSTYSVTVLTQPTGATCSVANGAGTIDSAGSDVGSVAVTCVSNASITGTVSGLTSGTSVTLTNGSVSLAVASNGVFAFPGVLAAGTAYNVTVSVQPAGHTCSVANGTGTVVSGTATNIAVTCS
jgi:hypothetical protein